MSRVNLMCVNLADMTKTERACFLMHEMYHLDLADIGEVLDTTSNRVRHLLKTARRKFRQCHNHIKW